MRTELARLLAPNTLPPGNPTMTMRRQPHSSQVPQPTWYWYWYCYWYSSQAGTLSTSLSLLQVLTFSEIATYKPFSEMVRNVLGEDSDLKQGLFNLPKGFSVAQYEGKSPFSKKSTNQTLRWFKDKDCTWIHYCVLFPPPTKFLLEMPKQIQIWFFFAAMRTNVRFSLWTKCLSNSGCTGGAITIIWCCRNCGNQCLYAGM